LFIERDESTLTFHFLRMALVGANPNASITGEDELPGKFHYFIGNDPTLWRTNVPSFAKVRYHGVYPGIDLVYYGNEGQLEYDFVVGPGVDPSQIALAIEGADTVAVDDKGDLRLEVAGRELFWRKPVLYQEKGGVRLPVAGEFELLPTASSNDGVHARQVAFRVAPYDRMLALIIDPVLAYSTYLGGAQTDRAQGIATDSQGCVYVTGITYFDDFPVTPGAFQESASTYGGAFVAKFSPAGNELFYSTFLAGPGAYSGGYAIAVDASGRAIVTGFTESTGFPTHEAFQSTRRGEADAFVTLLNPEGSDLVFSSYLGGTRSDYGHSIVTDAQSNIVIAGRTASLNFPVTNAVQSAHAGGRPFDWFITKIAPVGTNLLISTYLGGRDQEGESRMAVDPEGSIYIAGSVGWDRTWTAVAKLGSSGTDIAFMRTNVLDAKCAGMTLDSKGAIYLTGLTLPTYPPIPTTPGAFQSDPGSEVDAFVGKLTPDGTAFEYLARLGGAAGDRGNAIVVDRSGNAYVSGNTESADFPTRESIQAENHGSDAFVLKLDPYGSLLLWSTYLGGIDDGSGANGRDEALAITLSADGAIVVAGHASSPDFPMENPFQSERGRAPPYVAWDAFVAKIVDPQPAAVQITRSGTMVTISWSVSAAGFTLESTDSLAPAPNWQPEPTAPEIVGDHNVVTLEIGAGPRFFRLKKP
jgi:hypothetical protein